MDNLNYGVIGNCKSAALISETGCIEWLCLPDFDSPSVFAKLLDRERGGEFGIEVGPEYRVTQKYLSRTNILETTFTNGRDSFMVIDFMPRFHNERGYHCPPDLVRYLVHLEGKPKARFIYDPHLSYAKDPTRHCIEDEYLKSYTVSGNFESVYLYSNINFSQILGREEVVIEGDLFFLLSYNEKLLEINLDRIHLLFEKTKLYWLNWVDQGAKFSRYNEEIIRSSLVLKLLTYQQSGAILAAVTTSLPESLGEVRNWDYRFCWIRDASMAIATLTALGHYSSAERFLNFIVNVIPYKDEKIQIMYGIRGEKKLVEKELPWLSGYEGSKPVRIGNAAYLQKQNDIYGVLIDVIYNYFKLFRNTLANSEELWTVVRTLVRTVNNNWMKPDNGIWEYRSQGRHFTFSKVLCWVALDRGVKIAELLGKKGAAQEWAKIRDMIRKNILKKGWDPELQSFTQSYGSKDIDAANLLMANYGFLDPLDPKYVMTVRKTREVLSKDGLMYRYRNPDDFGAPKSSFTVCTFWMIKSLFLIGEKEEAENMFRTVLSYGNHLGLFSEDIDFTTKRLLGNFPQAYSHLALIDTALTLSGEEVSEDTKLMNILRHPL
ncbi:MAG: glycoside hydrolase family 15 protein [Firmicutes bacterium]|nr:glycoside hydrolase family 15 protein [Bacillota bacterium]